MKYVIVVLVLLLLAGCAEPTPTATPQPEATQTPVATAVPPTATPPTATPSTVPVTDSTPATPAATTQTAPTQTPVAMASPTTMPPAVSLTDSTGENLSFETRPVRVACLTEICPDIMAELGLEPVAVNDPLSTDPRFFGARANEFRVIGGSFFEPSLEDIAAAEPDLVIGLAGVHDGLRDALRPIAPLYIVNPLTYQDSIQYLKEVGAAMGRPRRLRRRLNDS